MKPILIAPLCTIALSGACAEMGTDADPVLDGAPKARLQNDLSAYRALARSQSQLDHEMMAASAIGAGVGGRRGEADEGSDALDGAMLGALAGAALGASEAADTRETIVLNCLHGRGHAVVN